MPKRVGDSLVECDKRKRKVITLDIKLEIIKRFEQGESKVKIGRDLGFHESTIRTILAKADDYRKLGKIASGSQCQPRVRSRSTIMVEMENLLMLWIDESNKKNIQINSSGIVMKALNIFSVLKELKYKDKPLTFSASKGWLENFKTRAGLRNVKTSKETVIRECDVSLPFSAELDKVEAEYDYHKHFNSDNKLKCTNSDFDDSMDKDVNVICELSDSESNYNMKQETYREQNQIPIEQMTITNLDSIFRDLEKITQRITAMDPDANRSQQVCQGIEDHMKCYRNIHKKLQQIYQDENSRT